MKLITFLKKIITKFKKHFKNENLARSPDWHNLSLPLEYYNFTPFQKEVLKFLLERETSSKNIKNQM